MSRPLDDVDRSSAEVSAESDRAWTCDELERLYCQALDAVGAVADELTSVTRSLASDPDSDGKETHRSAETEAAHDVVPSASLPPNESVGRSEAAESEPPAEGPSLSPAQVVEALLFVGGQSLTAKTICNVLRGETDADFVEQAVEELNGRYARQNRPYAIHLADGGYRIALHAEYEPLRNRVYGFGPKQVRLSQEALEVLALVAYRQPISRRGIEELCKRNPGSHLRQLVERGLVVVDQPGGPSDHDAPYRTSPRFLQLFGVGRIEDLPQIEDLNYK